MGPGAVLGICRGTHPHERGPGGRVWVEEEEEEEEVKRIPHGVGPGAVLGICPGTHLAGSGAEF